MTDRKRWLIILLSAVLATAVYYFLPETLGSGERSIAVPELARRSIAIFLVAVIF